MRTVKLYGKLAKRFGAEHRYDARTPAELVRALIHTIPGFKAEFLKSKWALIVGDPKNGGRGLHLNDMSFPVSRRESTLHILPHNYRAAGLDPFTQFLVQVGVAIVASVAISYLLVPKIKPPDPNGREKDEVNSYLFDGPVNVSEQGHPVPWVFGRVRVGSVVGSASIKNTRVIPHSSYGEGTPGINTPGLPGGSDWVVAKGGQGTARAAVEADNTLQSQATAWITDILSEGEIGGLVDDGTDADAKLKSVYLDGTPVRNTDGSWNYQGVELRERTGTPDQAPLPGFPTQETTNAVGDEVSILSGPRVETITNANVDRCRVTVRLPALYRQDTTTGDMLPMDVTIKISVQPSGGGYDEVITKTWSDKCTAPYDEDLEFPLPAGGAPWNVKFERITADAVVSTVKNQTFFQAITEIIDAKFTHPDTALIGMIVDAKQFGSSVPARGFLVDGIKCQVPSNYNPVTRVYTGTWDGTFITAVTDNPAWISYWICTNQRCGLGRFMTAIPDKFELYTIAQRCDQLVDDGYGGQEPRFAFNGVINTARQALTLLRELGEMFDAWLYASTTKVAFVQDSPADADALVVPANTKGGEVNYEGAPGDRLYSAFVVAFNDPEDGYRIGYEVVEDEELMRKIGWKPRQVAAILCTSRGQANRYGRKLRDDQKYKTAFCTYGAGPDHGLVAPGAIVEISDPRFTTERRGGIATAATSTSLTIDKPIDIVTGRTYTLKVTLPDGTIGEKTLTNSVATGVSVLTWSGALSPAPKQGAVWAVRNDLTANRKFRIRSVRENKFGEYALQGELYDENKWDRIESGLVIEPAPFVEAPTGAVPPPTSIVLREFMKTNGDAQVPSLHVSWNSSTDPRAASYDFAYRDLIDMSWTPIYGGGTLWREIINIVPGDYDFRVRARDQAGKPGPWFVLENQTLYGGEFTTGLPEVTGLNFYTNNDAIQTVLRWTRPVDGRPLLFEVIRSPDGTFDPNDGSNVVIGLTGTTEFVVAQAGWYFVRTAFMAFRSSTPPGVEVVAGDFPEAGLPAGTVGIEIVATLPVTGLTEGRTVFNTTDGKLYVYTSGAWSAAITDTTPGASTGIEIFSTNPTTGNFEGRTVYNSTDGKLYIYSGGVYKPMVSAGTVDGAVGIESFATAPTTGNFEGRIYYNTADGKLYRYTSGAYVAMVSQGSVGGAVGIETGASLPGSGNFEGRTFLLTTDGRVYVYRSGAWTSAVANLPAGQVGVETVATLPSSGNFEGRIVYLTTDNKLYRYTGSAWTAAVSTADLSGTISTGQIADSAIVTAKLADASLTAGKFTSTVRPVELFSTNPTTGNFDGRMVFNTVDKKLYRYNAVAGAYQASVAAVDVTGQLSDSQIAALAATKITGTLADAQIAGLAASKVTGTLSDAQLAAISAAKITGTLTDAQLAAISAAKITGTLSDSQLAAISAAKITGTITASQIADNILTAAKFTTGVRPVEVLGTLPVSGNFDGRMVYLTTDKKLYRYNSTAAAYTSSQAAADITGTLADAQIAALAASKITGTLSDTQLAAISAAKVTGTLTDSQLAAISAAKITGTIATTQIADNAITTAKITAGAITASQIAADTITAGNIAAGAITTSELAAGSVTAAKIVAGSITTAELAADTITAANIAAGAITASELAANSVVAGKIAAGTIVAADIAATTITAAKIAAGTITATQIAADTITAGNIAAGAITASELAANSVIAGKIAAGSIVAADIAAGTITAANIAAATITASQIAADTITAANIAANAITATELAAGSVVAGKIAAGTIVAADIAASTITGAKIAATTITAANITAGTITAAQIAAGTITATQISAGTITASQIAAGTILASNIAAGTITGDRLLAGTITATQIAAATIQAANIAAGTITASQIAASTITGSNIAAGTITAANLVANTITAGQIAAGTITATQIATDTIVASRLILTNRDNLVADSNYNDPVWHTNGNLTAWNATMAGVTHAAGVANQPQRSLQVNGSLHYYNSKTMPTEAAGTYKVRLRLYRPTGVTGYYSSFVYFPGVALALPGSNTANPSELGWPAINLALVAENTWLDYTMTVVSSTGYDYLQFYHSHNSISGPIYAHWEVTRAASADLVVDGAITANKIAVNSITASQIAIGTITGANLAGFTITTGNIAAAQITGTLIANGTIVTANIAAGQITADKIAANTITAAQIAASTITADRFVTGTITSAYIASGTIVAGNIAASTITGGNIAANTLTASNIVAGTITGDRLAANTITADRLVANSITAGQIAGATITGDRLVAGTITASQIASSTITASQIAAGTITATQIAAGTITGDKLVAGTITAAYIAANTIDASRIAAGTITAAEIATNAVTADKILAGAITAAKIAANVITASHIAANSITADRLSVTSLSAISGTIGLLRTATTGARVEIESNQIRVYDSAGTMRVRIGVW